MQSIDNRGCELWNSNRPMNARCAGLVLFVTLCLASFASAQSLTVKVPPLAEGLKNPESVVVTADGRTLVSVIGEFDKEGDGSIVEILGPGKLKTFVEHLDDPKGIAVWKDWLFIADRQRVWRVDGRMKADVYIEAKQFPRTPSFLNDIAVDADGNVFVSDTGDRKGNDGAVFRIANDRTVTTVVDARQTPSIKGPNGLLVEDAEHLLMADFLAGEVHRITLADGKMQKLLDGLPGADGLLKDLDGNLYITQWTNGHVSVLPVGATTPILLSDKFESAADLGFDAKWGKLVVPDMKAGLVKSIPMYSPVPKVDSSPLTNVKIEPAFAQLEFERPIVLTHGNDGTNRVYVASELGRIDVFPNDPSVSDKKLFLDLHEKVTYNDKQNEEGFLGLAFHPKFKENGQFFAYYSTVDTPHVTVVSRFRADGPNHDSAQTSSEEELLRITHPFWNHKGGTIAFGPDGYLYIAIGDGGAANDPYGNGQSLDTLLGKILRIDVDRQDAGKKYAIPQDNPFVGRAGAKPEIYAYGLRNVWRFAFDRQNGACWASDVGQDIWEEIDLIVSGGNYGWNLREGFHRFKPEGSLPRADLIEPIWEYHHDTGKSCTGGFVYRGQKVPELAGMYCYADYVTGQVYALGYDAGQRKATSNRPIAGNISPVLSFGEDEQGEVYILPLSGKLARFAANQ